MSPAAALSSAPCVAVRDHLNRLVRSSLDGPAVQASGAAMPGTRLTARSVRGCQLLDDFAVMVQLLMASIALSSLLIKRQREKPRRPFKIWFFDASKQACGSSGVHLLNVVFSLLPNANGQKESANPCVLYFLNLFLDCTIGIGILFGYLRLIDLIVQRFGICEMHSGNYGNPPSIRAWIKQSLAFFCALALMKFTVLLMLLTIPALEVFGKWVLSPLTSIKDPRFQVVFVLLLFPLTMNIFQFWVVDGVIKEHSRVYVNRLRRESALAEGGEDRDDDDDDLMSELDFSGVPDAEDLDVANLYPAYHDDLEAGAETAAAGVTRPGRERGASLAWNDGELNAAGGVMAGRRALGTKLAKAALRGSRQAIRLQRRNSSVDSLKSTSQAPLLGDVDTASASSGERRSPTLEATGSPAPPAPVHPEGVEPEDSPPQPASGVPAGGVVGGAQGRPGTADSLAKEGNEAFVDALEFNESNLASPVSMFANTKAGLPADAQLPVPSDRSVK